MSAGSQSTATPKTMLWAGRILSGLVAAMILMSAVMKFMMTTDAQKDLDHIGWNLPVVKTGLAVIELDVRSRLRDSANGCPWRDSAHRLSGRRVCDPRAHR